MAVDKKELWAGFARDAMAHYTIPEEIDGPEAMVDDMIAVAKDYADGMLDAFEERFGPGGTETASGRGRRRAAAGGKRRGEEEEEEEEEDPE